MAKLVTTPLSSLTNENSAVAIINANFDAVETAMEKTVSRDGTLPNSLTADLDLNSNDLLNGGEGNFSSIILNGSHITATVGLDSVLSVNGQIGTVVLDADDISASGTANQFTTTADINKLVGIEAGATGDQTPAEILTAIKTVDGAGSGLDADLLDGLDSTAFQPIDLDLSAIAGLTSAANKLPYATGSNTWALTDFTAAGRELVNDADAAAQRVTLSLGNVDNTSDVNKPVSTAQQTALNLKSNNASPTFTGIVTTAGQIAFPATANPSTNVNTLDDYREGTFTPGVAFGGASVGVTYNTQTGTYTRIGRLVYFNLLVFLTSKGSSTGTATFTGLPFAAGTLQASLSVGQYGVMVGLVDGMGATTIASTSNIQLFTGSATDSVVLTNTHFSNTSFIRISGSYEVP